MDEAIGFSFDKKIAPSLISVLSDSVAILSHREVCSKACVCLCLNLNVVLGDFEVLGIQTKRERERDIER